MYGLAAIKQINEEACTASSRKVLEQKLCRLGDGFTLGGGDIKHIGNKAALVDEFPNKKRVDTLFVDISGFGHPGERALTREGMESRLRDLVEEHGHLFVALEEIGQFQGHLAVWTTKGGKT